MKSKSKSQLFVGSIIILLIISTPYLLYFYQSVPTEFPNDYSVSENWETWFGTIKGGVYTKASLFVYWFLSKLVPLLLLVVWFITCKHWWVHAIIIPISVYLFQIIGVINDSEEIFDEVEFIYTVPITVIIMVILYFVRSKMAVYIQAVDLKKEMDENMKIPKRVIE